MQPLLLQAFSVCVVAILLVSIWNDYIHAKVLKGHNELHVAHKLISEAHNEALQQIAKLQSLQDEVNKRLYTKGLLLEEVVKD